MWRDTETVPISKEKNSFVFSLGALGRLDPMTPSCTFPQTLQESDRPILNIGSIVSAHNRLDSLTSLIGVVEWYGGNEVVKDVGFDDTV